MAVRAYILVQTTVGKAAEVAHQIRQITGVTLAEDVTGPYDVIVSAESDSVDDLGRLVVAEPAARPVTLRRGMALRVATKYPRLALRHYRSRGIQPEIIPLAGSVELGPLTGLSDQIVDLVESGETLRQNNLRETDTILHVTSRLIVHPASLKLKQSAIASVISAVRAAVAASASPLASPRATPPAFSVAPRTA